MFECSLTLYSFFLDEKIHNAQIAIHFHSQLTQFSPIPATTLRKEQDIHHQMAQCLHPLHALTSRQKPANALQSRAKRSAPFSFAISFNLGRSNSFKLGLTALSFSETLRPEAPPWAAAEHGDSPTRIASASSRPGMNEFRPHRQLLAFAAPRLSIAATSGFFESVPTLFLFPKSTHTSKYDLHSAKLRRFLQSIL